MEDGQGAELSTRSNVDGIVHGTMITSAGQALGANVPDDEDHGALKPLPERLVMELTAHRTLALREAVGRSPDVALTLLAHCLSFGINALHEKVNPMVPVSPPAV